MDNGEEQNENSPVLLTIGDLEFLKLVSEFFGEKVKRHHCPICGNEDVTVSRAIDNERTFHGLVGKKLDKVMDKVKYYFALTCINCGYTMLHDYQILHGWWIARQQKGQSA